MVSVTTLKFRKDRSIKNNRTSVYRSDANLYSGVKRFKKTEEGSLLNQTCVFFGSNMGNGSNHNATNLPVMLAGGRFKHGQYLAFDKDNNTPLANVLHQFSEYGN